MSARSRPSAQDLVDEANQIVIPVAEEVAAATRPAELGTAWVQQEFDARAVEQDASWRAVREAEDRPHLVHEASLTARAEADGFLVDTDRRVVARARDDYEHAARTLGPWVRRKASDSVRYIGATGLLLLCDAGAVTSALISLGDLVWTAAVLGIGVGVAAVTGGLVGAEVQEVRQSRIRAPYEDSLTEDERRYRQVFSPPEAWIPVTKIAVGVMLTIVAFLAVGIFALRADLEGALAGACFAAFAVATALGSAINSYMHADLVADLIGNYRATYLAALRHHARLARTTALADLPAAGTEAASIGREHDALGQAAVARVESLSWGVLRRNPHVFGHGEAARPIGSLPRHHSGYNDGRQDGAA